MARSIAAEMHSGFAALRQECTMNLRHRLPTPSLLAGATADVARIQHLWTMARDHYGADGPFLFGAFGAADIMRSEEHTSELQSLMRISSAVFCLKKKTQQK